MAKGYWIGHITVTDAEAYSEYTRLDTPVIESFGGRFIVRGGQSQVLEGEAKDRHVVIEFPDYATAVACYHSADYKRCAQIRQDSALSDIIIVEGHE